MLTKSRRTDLKKKTTFSSFRHVFLVDAGIHAREWIAPAAASYLIYRLAEGGDGGGGGNGSSSSSSSSSSSCMMTRNFDWHIVPVLNPDGYEYSRTSQSTRFWRKTRQPPPPDWNSTYDRDVYGEGTCCADCEILNGVDGNRNFAYRWDAGHPPAAAAVPCRQCDQTL